MSFALARCGVSPAQRCARRTVCYAEEPDKQSSISFTPGRNAALGYTEEDSAGQSNIFAVEPKTYVSSSSDANSNTTLVVGGIAGVAALALLVAGIGANSGNVSAVDTVYADAGKYETLSYYAQNLK